MALSILKILMKKKKISSASSGAGLLVEGTFHDLSLQWLKL